MKMFHYIAVIGGAVAAVVIMLVFLLAPENFGEPGDIGGKNKKDPEKARDLEERIRRLSTRLSESERKIAKWEESWYSGEAPEYFRNNFNENFKENSHDSLRRTKGSAAFPNKIPESKSAIVDKNDDSTKAVDAHTSSIRDNNSAKKQEESEKNYVGGLLGLYYSGRNFNELKLVLTDYEIDFDFGDQSPDRLIEDDNFSISWSGVVKADYTTEYTFYTSSDDGVRLWVGGKKVIDNWNDHAPRWDSGKVMLEKGYHKIRLDFYEHGGGATIKLFWSSDSMSREVISSANLFHDLEQEKKMSGEMR